MTINNVTGMDEARKARLARLAAMMEDARAGYDPTAVEEKPSRTVTPVALGAEKTVKGEKRDAKRPAVIVPTEPPLDAAGFLAAVKVAGFRPRKHAADATLPDGRKVAAGDVVTRPDGTPVLGPTSYAEKRSDEIAALRRFGGYDAKQDHGAILAAAVRRAKLALDGALGGDGKVPRTPPTVAGYVKGACDHNAKVVAHLEADVRSLVEQVAFFSKPGALVPVFKLDGSAVMNAAGFAQKVPISEDDRMDLLAYYEEKLSEAKQALYRASK